MVLFSFLLLVVSLEVIALALASSQVYKGSVSFDLQSGLFPGAFYHFLKLLFISYAQCSHHQSNLCLSTVHLLPTVILALKVSKNMHLTSADLSFKSMFRKKTLVQISHYDSWHFCDMKDFDTTSHSHCSAF